MVSHAGAVRDVADGTVPRLIAVLAAILPLGLLVQVLAMLPDYRHPAVPLAVWISLLVAAWRLIPHVRGSGLTRGQAAVAVAVALAAVSAMGWDRRPHAPAGAAIDVAAVDDHPIILDSIAGWVSDPAGGIRVVATAATADGLLAGPGRRAGVVLLDLDLGDGTTAPRNVAVIRAAGPAALVLSASDKPVSVRQAIRAGALGYVLKSEETTEVRAAIKAVAAGKDWISPRLAYIFATDDAPDRPVLSAQETRALQLYATGMPMRSVARRMCISEETPSSMRAESGRSTLEQDGRHPPNWTCTIEPSRTGISPLTPNRGPPLPVTGVTGDTRPRPVTRHDLKPLVKQAS